MSGQFRQLVGLCLLGIFIICGLWIVTAFSRAGLLAAQEQHTLLLAQRSELLLRRETVAAAQTSDLDLPQGFVWQGLERAVLEVAIQKALVDATEAADLRLVSFGPGSQPSELNSPALGYNAEVEGGYKELATLLLALENHQPQLAINYLWIRPLTTSSFEAKDALLSVRLGVWGFTDEPELKGQP